MLVASLSLGLAAAPTAGAQRTRGTSSVLAWGYNTDGQLGDGKTASTDVPVNVRLRKGTMITMLAAGYDHTLAVTSAGSVLAWG